MKRLILLLSLFLMSLPLAWTQTTVSSGNPNLDVQVKRAIVSGEDVLVDLILTCYSDWDVIRFIHRDRLCFFDDEGDLYHGDVYNGGVYKVLIEIDGVRDTGHSLLRIAKDNPRKIRFVVKNVNEYATSFTLIRIPYKANDTGDEIFIQIKNLPITSE